MRGFLTLLAASMGIILLAAAFLLLLLLGFGVAFQLISGSAEIDPDPLLALTATLALCLLPALALYRFAWKSLRKQGQFRLHAALGVCTTITVCSVVLALLYSSGAFDRKGRVAFSDGVLLISGQLDQELLRSFRNLMETADLRDVRVRLRSPGGDVWAGMAIGREIHRLELDVEVDRRCISACANYLFTAGKNKYLESADLVQFHGGALQPNFVEAALALLRAGTQMSSGDLTDLQEIRELYGLQEDYPINPAALILAERAFFDEIGASPVTPVFGQYGDYAPWYDDGVHDSYYYLPEDFALLGVPNVHLDESDRDGRPGNGNRVFRATVTAAGVAAVQTEMIPVFAQIEAAMPFDRNRIWTRQD